MGLLYQKKSGKARAKTAYHHLPPHGYASLESRSANPGGLVVAHSGGEDGCVERRELLSDI